MSLTRQERREIRQTVRTERGHSDPRLAEAAVRVARGWKHRSPPQRLLPAAAVVVVAGVAAAGIAAALGRPVGLAIALVLIVGVTVSFSVLRMQDRHFAIMEKVNQERLTKGDAEKQ